MPGPPTPPLDQGIAARVAGGEELTAPTPDEKAFDSLSLPDQANQAALASKFPETIKAFVGNRAIELPPEQAEKALRAGTIKLPAAADVHVLRADGSYAPVPATQVNQALADGAHLVSAREHHQADLSAKYDTGVGSGLLAAGLGAARGLSTVPGGGSISDELLGVSPEAQEAARYLEEHRPTLSGVGAVGGMLAQAALMPGGGLGKLAERGTAAVAGEGMVGRILAQSARAGAENAQLEHAQLVSEEALGEPPVTAEKYVASMGSALWQGAAVGGAGAGLLEGASRAGRGLVDSILSRASTAEDLDGVAEKTFGYRPKSSVGDALVKVQSLLSGADDEGREAIAQAGIQNWSREAKDLRAAALHADEVRGAAAGELAGSLDSLVKKSDAVADEIRGIAKRQKVDSPLSPPELQAQAMDSLQGVRNEVADMLSKGDEFGHAGALQKIDQQLRAHEKDMVSAVEKGDASGMFSVLHDTRRTIGSWAKTFASGAGDPLAQKQSAAVLERLGDVEHGGGVYETLTKSLGDEGTWGKAAVRQKAVDAMWNDYRAARSKVAGLVGDPGKIATYAGSVVNPTADAAHKAMADYASSAKALAGVVGDSFELASGKQALASAAASEGGKLEGRLAELGDKLASVNQVDALMKSGRGPGGLGLAVVGHLIGGPPGAAIAAAGGMLASPGKNIMRLAQLESLVEKFDGKVGDALERFFGRGVGEEGTATGKVARAAKVASKAARGASAAKEESTREEFARREKSLRELADPAMLNARLSGHLAGLQGSAPKTASALGATAAKAIAYLTAHLPVTDSPDPLTGEKGTPSLSEMSTFNLRFQAVEKPETVVDDLERGRITVEQVDALQNVYPGSYRELQDKAQRMLLEHARAGRPLPFQKRVALGVLLNIDTDPSLTAPAMGHATATFAMTAQAPQPGSGSGGGRAAGGGSARGGGGVGGSAASALATPEQRLESGRGGGI